VAPLAGDAVNAFEHAPVDDDAPAHPCAQNQADHDAVPARGAERGLSQRETVRVIRHPHLHPEPAAEVFAHRSTVEAEGVGVFQNTGRGIDGAGTADADHGGAEDAGLSFETGDDLFHLPDHVLVAAAALGGHAQAVPRAVGGLRVDDRALDLGASEVDAEQGHGD